MAKIVGIDLGTTNRKELFMRSFFGSKFNSHNEGNYSQSKGNHNQSCSYLGTIKDRVELFGSHCENLSNITEISKDTIARVSDFVNVAGSKLTNPGPINTKANQPADRLPLIPERTRENDFLTGVTLAKNGVNYN